MCNRYTIKFTKFQQSNTNRFWTVAKNCLGSKFAPPPPNKSIKSYNCGHSDTTVNKLILLASQEGFSGFAEAPSLPSEYSGRVNVYPSNLTLAVERLKFFIYTLKITIT